MISPMALAIGSPSTSLRGRFELIGPVRAPGREGPTNGMYALQKALQRRIAEGLDWLSIEPRPTDRRVTPWFWQWKDRSAAAQWDSQGLPFLQGPNLLFTDCRQPRIDPLERALLDAANCRAMFCHSDWYRELIARHRGPKNIAPVVTWPYPIDPCPNGPLPVEYDLLIYVKIASPPGLIERLNRAFPRHVRIYYGHYEREQLFEAARRSRACAFLAENDHGSLALNEILLAGCPAVGTRTGVPWVKDGFNGVSVEQLSPALIIDALERAVTMDRETVRSIALEEASPDRVAVRVVTVLNSLRYNL